MAQEWAKSFYKSKQWQRCRRSYIASVFGLCEICGKPGYILHHKIVLTPDNITDPDVSLNHDNLIYVCKDCHEGEHHPDIRFCRFDDDGQPLTHSPRV